MKKKRISVITACALLFVLLTVFLTGCKQKGLNIIFYDFETMDEVSVVNTVEDPETALAVMEAFEVDGDDVGFEVPQLELYYVLFEDPKDSAYDIWYIVAIHEGKVYGKLDTVQMDNEYAKSMMETGGFSDECYGEMNITEDEFRAFLY